MEYFPVEQLNNFKKKKNTGAQIFFIYVGNAEVESLHKEHQLLTENSELLKSDIIKLIKSHQYLNNNRYKLTSLLRYNITAEPSKVFDTAEQTPTSNPYLIIEKHIKTIRFADTVDILQGMNAIFFVFSRDELRTTRQSANTKRIVFNSKLRKTKRKKLIKDIN